jgi:hypothetical protein
MMEYRCLHRQHFDNGPYSIVPLREEDIFLIKEWRNAQMDILRQSTLLTDAEQKAYYKDVVTATFKDEYPQQILLSLLLNGQCIGYGGLVRIDWKKKQGEVSFLVDMERAQNKEIYKNDFSNFLTLIKELAFTDIHLKRLYTETYDIRPLHISVLESNGFAFEERLKNHIHKDGKIMDSLIHGCVP